VEISGVFFDVCLEWHEVVVNKRGSLVIAIRLGFQPSTRASGRRGAKIDEQRLLLGFGFRECRVSVFQPMYFHRGFSFSVIVLCRKKAQKAQGGGVNPSVETVFNWHTCH
jgi:hypothetical protein